MPALHVLALEMTHITSTIIAANTLNMWKKIAFVTNKKELDSSSDVIEFVQP